jgi:hypothetical protein
MRCRDDGMVLVLCLVSTAIVLCCFFRVQNVSGETSLFVPEFILVVCVGRTLNLKWQ